MARRGELTERIQAQAVQYLGREITRTELRLYPYLDYVMKNQQRIDPSKIDRDEIDVLSLLEKEGFIKYEASKLKMTKYFYNYMQIILWLGYVAYREEESE